MASSFYTYKIKKRFPVSHLFTEIFTQVVQDCPDQPISENLISALRTLKVPAPYSEPLLMGILEDIQEINRVRQERAADAPKKGKGGGPGDAIGRWISEQDFETLLLITCNFDYDAAYRAYAEMPALAAEKMVACRIEMEMHRVGATFESVVYGTGGKMKGGASQQEVITAGADQTPEAESEMHSALRSFRLM